MLQVYLFLADRWGIPDYEHLMDTMTTTQRRLWCLYLEREAKRESDAYNSDESGMMDPSEFGETFIGSIHGDAR